MHACIITLVPLLYIIDAVEALLLLLFAIRIPCSIQPGLRPSHYPVQYPNRACGLVIIPCNILTGPQARSLSQAARSIIPTKKYLSRIPRDTHLLQACIDLLKASDRLYVGKQRPSVSFSRNWLWEYLLSKPPQLLSKLLDIFHNNCWDFPTNYCT